jgi:hypothetical protein
MVILFVSVMVLHDYPMHYQTNPYLVVVMISSLYSGVFGVTLAGHHRGGRIAIGVQSFTVNLLMGCYFMLLVMLSRFHV